MKTARGQGWHFLLEKLAQVGMVSEARPSLSPWGLWKEIKPTSFRRSLPQASSDVALCLGWHG